MKNFGSLKLSDFGAFITGIHKFLNAFITRRERNLKVNISSRPDFMNKRFNRIENCLQRL